MKRIILMGVLITSFILVQPTLVVGQGKELSDRAKVMDSNCPTSAPMEQISEIA